MEQKRCDNCEHWKRSNETIGWCRKKPPTAFVVNSVNSLNPKEVTLEVKGFFSPIAADEKCGDHEPQKPELMQ